MRAPTTEVIAILAALVLAVGLAGCGQPKSSNVGEKHQNGTTTGNSVSVKESSTLREVRGGERKRAIVFIHGIFGDADASWMNSVSGKRFPDLLTESETFRDCNIYSFGFFSPSTKKANSIDQLAENLRLRLDHADVTTKHEELVFVCHSMGGLVARSYLLKYRDVIQQTKLLFLYSTPAGGASLASLAELASRNPQVPDLSPIVDNSFLQSQDNAWSAEPRLLKVATYAAYETVPTYGFRIVDELSAKRLANRRCDPLAFNHFDICKPESTEDDRFIVLEQAYRDTFGSIPAKEVELSSENLSELQGRLESRDDLISVTIRSAIRLPKKQTHEWTVGNVTFSDDGCIVVGESDLILDVRGWLRVDDREPVVVMSFPSDELVAAIGVDGKPGQHAAAQASGGSRDGRPGLPGGDGEPGRPGANGLSSGNVILKLTQSPSRSFVASLIGQDGGKGGAGGDGGNGSNGLNGRKVEIAGDGVSAKSGAGNGGHGGQGGNGGTAGLGGTAGNGGKLTVTVPDGILEKTKRSIRIDERVARHGRPGQPGVAGKGGAAGSGGEGKRLEGGLGKLLGSPKTHPRGEDGKPGDDGVNGVVPEFNARSPQAPQIAWEQRS